MPREAGLVDRRVLGNVGLAYAGGRGPRPPECLDPRSDPAVALGVNRLDRPVVDARREHGGERKLRALDLVRRTNRTEHGMGEGWIGGDVNVVADGPGDR